MAALKEGDRVRILSRPPTEEDAKSGTYFAHYAGLTGSIQKVYNKLEVAVEVEHDSLTRDIRKRHEDVRDQMKTKWLEGLSEEGRGKLTEREKDFNLRYVVLVPMADLEKMGARPAARENDSLGSGKPSPPTPASSGAPIEAPAPESAPRKTLAELEAAEEAELLRRAEQKP